MKLVSVSTQAVSELPIILRVGWLRAFELCESPFKYINRDTFKAIPLK